MFNEFIQKQDIYEISAPYLTKQYYQQVIEQQATINKQTAIETINQPSIGTGFHELDQIIKLLQAGDIILLSSEYSVLCDAVMQHILPHLIENKHPTLLLSPMINTHEFIESLVLRQAGIKNKLNHTQEKLKSIEKSAETVMQYPLFIEDAPYLSCSALQTIIETLHADGKPLQCLVISDVSVLINSDVIRGHLEDADGHIDSESMEGNPALESYIDNISHHLQQLAIAMNLVIIVRPVAHNPLNTYFEYVRCLSQSRLFKRANLVLNFYEKADTSDDSQRQFYAHIQKSTKAVHGSTHINIHTTRQKN